MTLLFRFQKHNATYLRAVIPRGTVASAFGQSNEDWMGPLVAVHPTVEQQCEVFIALLISSDEVVTTKSHGSFAGCAVVFVT